MSVRSWGSKGSKSHTGSRGGRGEEGQDSQSEFGSILRHVILKAVSHQLVSAAERENLGSPTAMATSHMIAVGTQLGMVLVFDSSQVTTDTYLL